MTTRIIVTEAQRIGIYSKLLQREIDPHPPEKGNRIAMCWWGGVGMNGSSRKGRGREGRDYVERPFKPRAILGVVWEPNTVQSS